MQKHSHLQVKRFPFTPKAPNYFDFDLSPGWGTTHIDVMLRGPITLSGGTTSGTSIGPNPGGLIQQIKVDAAELLGGFYSGGTIFDCTPRSIQIARIYDEGFEQSDLFTPNGLTGAAGTFNILTNYRINFAMPRAVRPIETALRKDQFGQLKITIKTSDIPTMLLGNDRAVDYSGLYIDVIEHCEYLDSYYPHATPYMDDLFVTINAANKKLQLDAELSATESYIDALVISETTNDALSDSIVNSVAAWSEKDNFWNLENDQIKVLQLSASVDAVQSFLGLYRVECAPGFDTHNGLLGGALPRLKLQFDVSNPGGAGNDRLIVCTRRVVPTTYKAPKGNVKKAA